MANGIWKELDRDYESAYDVVSKVVYFLCVIFVIATAISYLLFDSYIVLTLRKP